MSFEDKRKALENHCINNGKMGKDEMDAEIARMAGMCPPATATEKGLTTDVDKAYEVLMIMEGNQAAPASPAQTQAAGVSQPVAGATAAEMAAVHANVMTNFEEKLAIGSNSQIVKYLLSRPAPDSYIPEGTTGVIDQTKWMESIEKKISSGDYTVVDDYQDPKTMEMVPSKTNYETLKNAAANGTPVNVYRGKLGTRPQGYVIRVGSATSTGAKEETFTREMAMQFLTWKCNGFLGAPGQATIRLKSIQSKANKAIPGQATQSKTVMTDYNKQALIGSGGFDTLRVAGTEAKDMTLKSELFFKVIDNTKTTKKATHPQRIVRASVKASVPVLVLQQQYDELFGKSKADGSIPPTSPEEQAKMAKVLVNAKMQILNDPEKANVLMLTKEYKEDIAAVKNALQGQAPSNAAAF